MGLLGGDQGSLEVTSELRPKGLLGGEREASCVKAQDKLEDL